MLQRQGMHVVLEKEHSLDVSLWPTDGEVLRRVTLSTTLWVFWD